MDPNNAMVALPAPPYTYLGTAENLIPGVKPLVDALSSGTSLALAFVCAHLLECLLKAYLSRRGSDIALKKPNIRHNLNALWTLAVTQGLPVQASPPAWVDRLSSLHNSPYYLRYSTGVHGVVLPAPEPMATELTTLLGVVRQHIS